MIFLGGASSCTSSGIKWDPNFYKANSATSSIVDRNNIEVKCYEPRFDEFACLHKDKIKELADILTRARIPRDDKQKAIKLLHEVIKDIEEIKE